MGVLPHGDSLSHTTLYQSGDFFFSFFPFYSLLLLLTQHGDTGDDDAGDDGEDDAGEDDAGEDDATVALLS